MTLERLVNFGKKAVAGTLIASALVLGACGKKDSPAYIPPATCQNPDQNLPETWFGEYGFQDLMTGKYEIPVYGSDVDDVLSGIKLMINGAEWDRVPSETLLELPIVEGVNIPTAVAYNGRCGETEDPTPAEFPNIAKGFYSPTEDEARALIDGILQNREYVEGVDYYKDQLMIINNNQFYVDYWFRKADGTHRFIINFAGHKDNLNNEQNNKNFLNNELIPNLYLAYVPIPSPDGKYDLDLVTGNLNVFLDDFPPLGQ